MRHSSYRYVDLLTQGDASARRSETERDGRDGRDGRRTSGEGREGARALLRTAGGGMLVSPFARAMHPIAGTTASRWKSPLNHPMKKNYVLDTNVLLHDPRAIFRF